MNSLSSTRESLRFVEGERSVLVTAECLAVLDRKRQLAAGDPERGGQLFARISGAGAEIVIATEVTARRSRFSFLPNRRREQEEIDARFREGFHFVGDWHSHPEDVPRPSVLDLNKIGEIFAKSTHQVPWFVLLIVGRVPFPRGMYVGLVNHEGVFEAMPALSAGAHRDGNSLE